jgi:CheY-like chemotaxis protein
VISGDDDRRRGIALGAMTYLEKSVTNESLAEAFEAIKLSAGSRVKKLLVVCGNPQEREAIVAAVTAPDLELTAVGTAGEALAVAKAQYLDGIIVHLDVADIGALGFIEQMQAQTRPHVPPVILACDRALTTSEEVDLARLSRTSVVKLATTRERVLDETVLLLHRAEADLSTEQCHILAELRETDATLVGKTVLIIDDDVRNIFALTSLLEDHQLKVLHAENGRAGIELLRSAPEIDLVLTDIMMPEMDGYETMRAIRKEPQFRSLPIVALTAKAMKGDRAKCIEAGASDYITKPVDLEQLFSVLRVSVNRGQELAAQSAIRGV